MTRTNANRASMPLPDPAGCRGAMARRQKAVRRDRGCAAAPPRQPASVANRRRAYKQQVADHAIDTREQRGRHRSASAAHQIAKMRRDAVEQARRPVARVLVQARGDLMQPDDVEARAQDALPPQRRRRA
jgi:hypothetical protein